MNLHDVQIEDEVLEYCIASYPRSWTWRRLGPERLEYNYPTGTGTRRTSIMEAAEYHEHPQRAREWAARNRTPLF